MDEGLNMEKSPGVSDEDIVHLLNTKKQKSREILSITNAAVDAISNRAPSQPKTTYGEQYSSRNYSENKENKMDARISDSFVSTGSGDGSFHGQKRVRIPSRLLREIKSPMDRSSSGNISSSESKDTSSGSLFASQSGSMYDLWLNYLNMGHKLLFYSFKSLIAAPNKSLKILVMCISPNYIYLL